MNFDRSIVESVLVRKDTSNIMKAESFERRPFTISCGGTTAGEIKKDKLLEDSPSEDDDDYQPRSDAQKQCTDACIMGDIVEWEHSDDVEIVVKMERVTRDEREEGSHPSTEETSTPLGKNQTIP